MKGFLDFLGFEHEDFEGLCSFGAQPVSPSALSGFGQMPGGGSMSPLQQGLMSNLLGYGGGNASAWPWSANATAPTSPTGMTPSAFSNAISSLAAQPSVLAQPDQSIFAPVQVPKIPTSIPAPVVPDVYNAGEGNGGGSG